MTTLSRIDSHFLIKITDFGLSEDVFVRNYYRQGTSGEVVKLPVKWMAPESLSDGHFSEKSDVVCVLLVNNHPLIAERISARQLIRVHISANTYMKSRL